MAESSKTLEQFLFPNGVDNAPSKADLIKKFKNKTLTVRDALIIHAQDTGIRFGAEELGKSTTATEMADLFGAGEGKPTRATGFLAKVKKFRKVLDNSFFDVTYDLNELNKLTGPDTKVAAQAIDGSTKKFFDANKTAIGGGEKINYPRDPIAKVPQKRGGMAFLEVPSPKSVWPQIMQATQEIAADPKYGPKYAKAFFLSAILPIRGNDITQITVDKKFATGLETVRPHLARNADGLLTLSLDSMLGRGQKGLPRKIVLTPFLSNLLGEDYDNAKKSGNKYLFDTKDLKGKTTLITTSKLTAATKQYLVPLMKEFEDILGREIVGIKDLRKIASSTIAMHPSINNPEIASELLGHTGDDGFVKGVSKMEARSYISNIAGVGAEDKITNVLALYESLIADTLEYDDVNDLARNSGLSLEDDTLHIEKIENTSQPQKTRVLTAEEIEENAIKRRAQNKLYLQRLEEKVSESILTSEEKLIKAEEVKEERKERFGDNNAPAGDKIQTKNSPFLQQVAEMNGIDVSELEGLTAKEIEEKIRKRNKGTLGKVAVPGMIALAGVNYALDPGEAAAGDIAFTAGARTARLFGGAAAGGPAVVAGAIAAEAITPSKISDDVRDLTSNKNFMEMGRISELTGESFLDVNTKAQALTDIQDIEAQASRVTEGGSFEHPQITRERQANERRLDEQLFEIGF